MSHVKQLPQAVSVSENLNVIIGQLFAYFYSLLIKKLKNNLEFSDTQIFQVVWTFKCLPASMKHKAEIQFIKKQTAWKVSP